MKNILLEALNDFQKKYVDDKLGGSEYDPSKSHVNMFDSYVKLHPDRIQLDLPNESERNCPIEVIRHLDKNGYRVEDYKKGLASKTFIDINGNEKKQMISIGKVLQKTNANNIDTYHTNVNGDYKSVMDVYNESRDGVNKHLKLVISRDKHDIAGMSTNRNWQSCMTLPCENVGGGSNHHYIESDLKHHTLAAYLIKNGDDNLEKPLGRALIKKYTSSDGESIYRANGKLYGNIPPEYVRIINEVMKKHYPSKNKNYDLDGNLYPDGETSLVERMGMVDGKHYNESNKLHDYIDELGNYQPAIKNNEYTGYFKNGILHRDGDLPASTIYSDGKVELQEYYKNGVLHREKDNPAVIEYHPNGNIKRQALYRYGILHSNGKVPTATHYNQEGKLYRRTYYNYGEEHSPNNDTPSSILLDSESLNPIEIEYHKNGMLHRDNGKPSLIRYNDKGEVSELSYHINGDLHSPDNNTPAKMVKTYDKYDSSHVEEYYKNGMLHRDGDLPALISNENGDSVQKFYKDGKLHRENAPAVIKKYENKNIIEYYNNDELHSPDINTPSYSETRDDGTYLIRYHKNGVLSRNDELPYEESYYDLGNGDSEKNIKFNERVDHPYQITEHDSPKSHNIITYYHRDNFSTEKPIIKIIMTNKSNGVKTFTNQYDHVEVNVPTSHSYTLENGEKIKEVNEYNNRTKDHPLKIEKRYKDGELTNTILESPMYSSDKPYLVNINHVDGTREEKFNSGHYTNRKFDSNNKILSYGNSNIQFSHESGRPIISTDGGKFYKKGKEIHFKHDTRGDFILKNRNFYGKDGIELSQTDKLYRSVDNVLSHKGELLNNSHESLFKGIKNEE